MSENQKIIIFYKRPILCLVEIASRVPIKEIIPQIEPNKNKNTTTIE